MALPIFLTGFMAAGKSTVGAMLATKLGGVFFDVDSELARCFERDVATWVATDETSFRNAEAAMIEGLSAAAQELAVPTVIATGGGAILRESTRECLRSQGLWVWLAVSAEQAFARATAQTSQVRPLMQSLESAAHRLQERQTFYRQAHVSVNTEDLSCEQVVARLVRVYARATEHSSLGDNIFYIATEDAISQVRHHSQQPVLADPGHANKQHLVFDGGLLAAWPQLSSKDAIVVVGGEACKTMAGYEQLAESLLSAGVDRRATIAAVGGGAVTDVTGFVAATALRGVAWRAVPTTLLAMIDASIGGKTAINTKAGKNLLGAFWQPTDIDIYLPYVETLPSRERISAFGELIKYAILDGASFWSELVSIAQWSREGGASPTALQSVVLRAARYKAHIVSQDPRETRGQRILLNLGHTFGHAIEKHSNYQIAHGEAVALGIIAAAKVSAELGLCKNELVLEITKLVQQCGLAHDVEPWLHDECIGYISADKKRAQGTMQFIAIRDVGKCEVHQIPTTELVGILRSFKNR